MGRYGVSSLLLGMLAVTSVYGQTTDTSTTDTTTTTTTDLTTDLTTDITTDITSLTTTDVVSLTLTSDTTSTTDTTETTTSDITTVITTTTMTDVTTVIDSTTTVISSSTETVTTLTVTSPTTTSSVSSTTTNAPQYTGATFHIESAEGDLGEGATEAGLTRKNLIFGIRSEFTLNGFGELVSKAEGYIAQTNGAGDTVFVDSAPLKRVKRQATGTPLTCSVATTGVLSCTGAMGSVFYTDGTSLYLGAAVPAGFTPITLIAVIDAPLVPTSGTVVIPSSGLPTTGPTTPAYAGWGQWSYPTPSGVPIALTTTCVYPVATGIVTETITITSLHCGCTETPIPSSVVMTTYVTTCPESWGYTAPVTVIVPVIPTGAVWATSTGSSWEATYGNSGWNSYAPGPSTPKPTGGNSTYNSWNGIPYKGAASPMGVSAGLMTISVAMLALFL